MTISPAVLAGVNNLQTELNSVLPLETATRLQFVFLQQQSVDLLTLIDEQIASTGVALDAADPVGYPGSFPDQLLALTAATYDQNKLVEVKGLVGRSLFNLTQARS